MPGFSSPTVSFNDIFVELYGYMKRTRGVSIPDNGATLTEVTTMVTAICNASNMGCLSWNFKGVKRYISYGQVAVYDEAHDENMTLRMLFQDLTDPTKPEVTIQVPAPNHNLFSSGVIFDPASTLGAPMVAAIIVCLNAPTGAELASYSFVGGYLNTASGNEKRALPSITDPASSPPAP